MLFPLAEEQDESAAIAELSGIVREQGGIIDELTDRLEAVLAQFADAQTTIADLKKRIAAGEASIAARAKELTDAIASQTSAISKANALIQRQEREIPKRIPAVIEKMTVTVGSKEIPLMKFPGQVASQIAALQTRVNNAGPTLLNTKFPELGGYTILDRVEKLNTNITKLPGQVLSTARGDLGNQSVIGAIADMPARIRTEFSSWTFPSLQDKTLSDFLFQGLDRPTGHPWKDKTIAEMLKEAFLNTHMIEFTGNDVITYRPLMYTRRVIDGQLVTTMDGSVIQGLMQQIADTRNGVGDWFGDFADKVWEYHKLDIPWLVGSGYESVISGGQLVGRRLNLKDALLGFVRLDETDFGSQWLTRMWAKVGAGTLRTALGELADNMDAQIDGAVGVPSLQQLMDDFTDKAHRFRYRLGWEFDLTTSQIGTAPAGFVMPTEGTAQQNKEAIFNTELSGMLDKWDLVGRRLGNVLKPPNMNANIWGFLRDRTVPIRGTDGKLYPKLSPPGAPQTSHVVMTEVQLANLLGGPVI